jgi:hypothetical protein
MLPPRITGHHLMILPFHARPIVLMHFSSRFYLMCHQWRYSTMHESLSNLNHESTSIHHYFDNFPLPKNMHELQAAC